MTTITPHPNARLLNSIWHLILFPHIKLLAKNSSKLATKSRLGKFASNIDICPSCNQAKEGTDLLSNSAILQNRYWLP